MGWMAVHVPVKAFENTTGIQVWYLGSGLDFDKFNSGAGTKGAGIVILNGNTTGSFLEYILDLDDVRNPNPVNAAGVWDFQNDVFTLLGDAGATVRVIGDTVVRRIQVKDGADVTVLLDGMSIITPAGGSPFALGNGSKATLHLADGTINNLTASSTYAGLQANEGIAGLVIEGSNGELRATTSGYNSTGIGGANAAGGAITINGGVVNALGGESGAGIGGGGIAAGGAITINGGVITATGNFGGSGIGGGSGWGGGSTSSIRGGSITINGGLITAIGGSYGRGGGAGIGGGGGMDFGGDGGTIHITGGVVYAKSVMGTGIGGGSPNTAVPGKSGDITIDGGIVIAEGGKGAGIGGGHGGSGGHSHNSYNGDGQNITITDSTVIAKGGVGENYGSAGIGGGVGMTGYGGAGGTIQITNAVVIAEGGNGANGNGAGIGSGSGSYGGGNGGTITLSGGTIYAKSYGTAESIGMATNGSSASISKTNSPIIFAEVGNANIVNDPTNGILVGSGNVDLSGLIGGSFPNFNHGVITLSNLTILAGATLTVPPFMSFNQGGSGITLTNNGAIVNNGTIAIGSGNSLIYNSGIVKNYGTVNTSGGTLNPTHPPGPAHIKKAQVVI
jgi:hypothetical protein